MKIILQQKQQKQHETLHKEVIDIPDGWSHNTFSYVFHNDFYVLPNLKNKVKISEVLHDKSYKKTLKPFLNNLDPYKTIIAFNEIFKTDAGLFSTALRQGMTVEKIKEVLKFIRENTSSKISITEHRLGSLFLARQKWFKEVIIECKEYIDAVGLQVWVQPSSPLYQLQKEAAIRLVLDFQKLGFEVFISESAVFEKHREYQAEILDKMISKYKEAGVTSFTYWYLRDLPELKQPNRDCSLGPGLFTEFWEPKPILDVIKKYAKSI